MLAASLALACVAGTCTVASADARGGSPFPVYDNTFYRNVDLEQAGAVKSNIVYEYLVAELTGQDANKFRGTRPGGAELNLPDKNAFEALVQSVTTGPGPVVLDFETLYLEGPQADAERHFEKLRTMLEWAHEAVPGRTVGYYGVLGNTSPRYYKLERRLAEREDALFPSLYTFSDNRPAWLAKFRRIMTQAAKVAPGKPVYAYLWPQYHDGTKLAGHYLTPDHWRYELETAQQLCSGVVIWGPRVSDPDRRWVDETAAFLGGRAS